MSANTISTDPRIIVGVDGSESSVVALRWAVRQARLTGGIVDAIIAWQIPALASGYGYTPISVEAISGEQEEAERLLAEAISKATGPQDTGRVHSVVTQAIPGQALVEASADADLLVVGMRGHGRVASALLGSVSQYCLRHAHCPVVVIRGTAAYTKAA
jgi:nucleotide-binding universal stress UspA family protein